MSRCARMACVMVLGLACLSSSLGGQNRGSSPPDVPTITDAEYQRWKTEFSNWGRWGRDDQIGTLNLITPVKRREAAALVREGFSLSLASNADTREAVDNPRPYEFQMLTIGTDRIAVAYHGIAHTHLDAWNHIQDNGVFYNGYRPDEASVMRDGHQRNSILGAKNGIVTRGVLIDIPRLKGVPFLEPGTPIYVSDIEAWERRAGVRVSAGDAIFIRTGVWARRSVEGPWLRGRAEGGRSAGLHPSVIPWLKQRDVAVMGSDHPQYVAPAVAGTPAGAIHDFALVYLGMPILDNCDLEALAAAAAERRRWSFLLTVSPLPIQGGTGSPVNPIAVF